MLHLIPDWKRRWRKLWSIRLAVLAALLSGVELLVPYFDGMLPPRMFAVLAALTAIAAALARIVAQPKAAPERRRTPRLSLPARAANAIPPGALPPGRSWRGEAPLHPSYPPRKFAPTNQTGAPDDPFPRRQP
jgi:hypothetical protein